jgi:hypothetical protein
MPKSEASQKGLSLGDMFKDVGILGGLVVCFLLALFFGGAVFSNFMSERAASIVGWVIGGGLLIAVGVMTKFSMGSVLLFGLFLAHLLVGAVELGTDGWIQNITGSIFSSEVASSCSCSRPSSCSACGSAPTSSRRRSASRRSASSWSAPSWPPSASS